MVAINKLVRNRREAFVGELTEAALAALADHHVAGRSLDLEVHLWKRLAQAIDELSTGPHGADDNWEHRLGVLTRAAYEVALEHGFAGAFLELEMNMWAKLRWVVRSNRFVPRKREERLSAVLALR
jgi:hypothetical protein